MGRGRRTGLLVLIAALVGVGLLGATGIVRIPYLSPTASARIDAEGPDDLSASEAAAARELAASGGNPRTARPLDASADAPADPVLPSEAKGSAIGRAGATIRGRVVESEAQAPGRRRRGRVADARGAVSLSPGRPGRSFRPADGPDRRRGALFAPGAAARGGLRATRPPGEGSLCHAAGHPPHGAPGARRRRRGARTLGRAFGARRRRRRRRASRTSPSRSPGRSRTTSTR